MGSVAACGILISRFSLCKSVSIGRTSLYKKRRCLLFAPVLKGCALSLQDQHNVNVSVWGLFYACLCLRVLFKHEAGCLLGCSDAELEKGRTFVETVLGKTWHVIILYESRDTASSQSEDSECLGPRPCCELGWMHEIYEELAQLKLESSDKRHELQSSFLSVLQIISPAYEEPIMCDCLSVFCISWEQFISYMINLAGLVLRTQCLIVV